MPGTGVTLDGEWALLLAACSESPTDRNLSQEKLDELRTLLQRPVQWKPLFARADKHGTLPLLYTSLSGLEGAVPAEEMRWLKQSYQTNLHKALLLSREQIRIVGTLTERGIEVMPYKGLALAEILYGDIALRQSGDIDLLIRPQDLPRVRDVVRELGYKPQLAFSETEERAYLKSGYECAFDGEAGPNLLELQWAIQPRFYAVDFDMDGLFRRALTIPVAGHPMKTPSPADLLIVLSVHAAKHVWGRLVWLCDIAQLMRRSELDWKWVGAQARQLGVMRILRVTMLLANRLLGFAIPAAARIHLGEDSGELALVEEILPSIFTGNGYGTESLAYFRLMMRLRERQGDRLRFMQRLALTPGPGEWKAVRLPRALFGLYPLVRLSRLAARLVRA
jgi:hypothetical protein